MEQKGIKTVIFHVLFFILPKCVERTPCFIGMGFATVETLQETGKAIFAGSLFPQKVDAKYSPRIF